MSIRPYDQARDLAAVQRIWYEVGWVDDEKGAALLEDFLAAGNAVVSDIDSEAECMVHSTPGVMRYQSEDLRLSAVTAVTTSRIARRLGLAKRLTARILAEAAEAGAEVSALGMFDQGFYDKVGFGSGCYEQWISFDPATLLVDRRFRVPKRLSQEDWPAMHRALCDRRRGHGGCNLDPPAIMKAEVGWTENGFGLGYFDGPAGELTHFFWGSSKGENGPYRIVARAHRNNDDLLELLALVKSLGDQVSSILMLELGDVQFQDLLREPLRNRRNTEKSVHENNSWSLACWQLRILNLQRCLAKTHLDSTPVRFNLKLTDPVVEHLDTAAGWQGIGGDFVVTLGPDSSAEPGEDDSLLTLEASAGAFSRLWFGIQPATSLEATDMLSAPSDLLDALDRCIRLPKAHIGWDF